MIALIYDWGGGNRESPHPDAIKFSDADGKFAACYTIEIDNLEEWIKEYKGSVMIHPPGTFNDKLWMIYVDGPRRSNFRCR